ncbi:hypothetical protein GIB67_018058 [Kingdonia uniflora]|uniref:Pentatricopeptide repeat-containing protein n=1 Tax=Kingdonia uniflora TaxID=39325 RepID=A0A7J7NX63_9MAGN|nr:hypothetical protein GIB67_018058 [Kingdonia uniflora]
MKKLLETSLAAVVMKKKMISELHKVSTITSSFHFNPQSTLAQFKQFVRDRYGSGNLGIEEAMGLFNDAIQLRPSPSIHQFNQLLGVICKLKLYSTVDFGFAVVGNIFKSGFEPHIVIFTTLLKGLFKENRVKDAIQLSNKVTYGTIVDGLCKIGNVDQAIKLLKDMERKLQV